MATLAMKYHYANSPLTYTADNDNVFNVTVTKMLSYYSIKKQNTTYTLQSRFGEEKTTMWRQHLQEKPCKGHGIGTTSICLQYKCL